MALSPQAGTLSMPSEADTAVVVAAVLAVVVVVVVVVLAVVVMPESFNDAV